MYQVLYNKAKVITRNDAWIKFLNEKEPLYSETDASGVGLGAGLLLIWDSLQFPQDKAADNAALHPIAFESKSPNSAETSYSNI